MRLIDSIRRPAAPAPPSPPVEEDQARGYSEDKASGASILMTTYGSPSREPILPTFASFATDAYMGNGVAFSVILARLMLFAEAELKWQDRTTGKLFGTADLGPLEAPWQGGGTGELFARMEQDASLAGNAFTRRVGMATTRRPDDELERLRPDLVTIVSEIVRDAWDRPHRRRLGYAYAADLVDAERGVEFYTTDEVAHWSPIPDPLARWRGMSWLTPVVRELDADSGLTDYKTAYLTNAATPNLLIKYERGIDDDEVERIRDRITARYAGRNRAFKTMILDRGADATIVGTNLEDMGFTKVQAAGENRIAAAGGVPGIVVGLKEGLDAATYSNYQQAMRRFGDLTMRPNWRGACQALSAIVDPPPGARLWYDAGAIAALREGEKERAEITQVRATAADTLIRAGFKPDTVTTAITAGDFALLEHTGRIPTALYQDGQDPAATGGTK